MRRVLLSVAAVLVVACAPPTSTPEAVESSPTVTANPTPPPTPFVSSRPSPTPSPWLTLTQSPTSSGGNNREAQSYAKDVVASTSFWKMWVELQPVAGGDAVGSALIEYRKSVRTFSAWVIFLPSGINDWKRYDDSIRRNVVDSIVSVAHRGGALQTGPIDYYPNASAHVVFITETGQVLATGDYDIGSDKTTIVVSAL